MTQTFSQTSNEPYNRHNYRLRLKSGKILNFDDYEDVQAYWFIHSQIPDYLDLIEVLDKQKSKEKVKSKGFGS
jgi:hypothetical protein